MSYPTVNFQGTRELGAQPINETSATQRHPLGAVVLAQDVNYGVGRFMYGVGVASTDKGDLCTIDSKNGDTARAVHGGATSYGPCGVAMSANTAGRYGWYCIEGAVPVASATVSADAPLYLTSTAGTVDDAVVAGDLITGIVSRSASSGGYTTCQLSNPSIGATSGGTTFSGIYKIALSAAAEAGDAIVVTGAVTDLTGAVAVSVPVVVRSLAVTADKGDITVVSGTEKKTVNPATGENVSWITTTAGGAFSVSIADTAAESVLVTASTANGLEAALVLTFA